MRIALGVLLGLASAGWFWSIAARRNAGTISERRQSVEAVLLVGLSYVASRILWP
jgi:hypothetical protein